MSLVNDMLRDLEKKPVPRGKPEQLVSSQNEGASAGAWRSFLPAIVAFLVVSVAVWFSLEPATENEVLLSEQESAVPLADAVKDSADETGNPSGEAKEQSNQSPAPETKNASNASSAIAIVNQPKTDYYDEAVNALIKLPGSQTSSPSGELVKESAAQNKAVDKPAQKEPSSTVIASTALGVKVNQILVNAERALGLDRLTSPLGDNAFDYYSEVLSIDANNTQALIGLAVIAERYVELAQEYALEGNTTRAGVLLRRASAVAPGHPAIANFWPNINAHGYAIADVENDAGIPVKTQSYQARAIPQRKSKVIASTSRGVVPGQVSSTLSVVRDPAWLDQKTASDAKQVLARGDRNSARLQLRAFVSAHPQSSHSLRVLFEILLRDQAFDEAKLLLNSAAHLPGVDQAVMASYWFLAKDDLEGAERVIDNQDEKFDLDTDYLSLKAGVLHKVQRYDESARAYQRLLQQDQNNSAYWLGLGVALDAMSRNSEALNAFRRALQGQKNEEVRRYVSARVEALSRTQLTTENP